MDTWSPWDLLPGAWVALVALVAAWGLRRWLDPVPRWVWAVFALYLGVLFGPVLVGGAVLLPLDTLRGFAPFSGLAPTQPHGNLLQGDLIQLVAPSAELVRAELLAGRWPLWNPYAGAGLPLLMDPQAQPFQPLVLAALPFPWVQAAGVVAALRVLVALVFTYLLLGRQGLRPLAALFGATAFGLGGFVLLWLGWPLASSAAWLPAVLYALVCVDQEGRRRDLWLLGGATGALALAGHPETILYALALALVFGLDRLRGRFKGYRWWYLRRVLGTWLLTGALVAPVLLPTALYLPGTVRWALAREAREPIEAEAAPEKTIRAPGPAGLASSPGALKSRLALAWLPSAVPNGFGNSRYLDYWGGRNSNEDASGFVGTAALLAALLAVWMAGVRLGRLLLRKWLPAASVDPRRPQEALMTALALSGFVALAVQDPGSTHRWLLVVAFSLAYLGAVTVDRFVRGEGSWVALGLATAGLGAGIVWGSTAFPHPEDPSRLEVLRLGWLHWHLRFLALAAGALAALQLLAGPASAGLRRMLGLDGVRAPWAGRTVTALLVVAAAAELILAHGDVNPPAPKSLAVASGITSVAPAGAGPEALATLARLPGVRDPATGGRIAAVGRALPPNLATLWRLADIRIYNPVEPLAYLQATAAITVEPRGNVPEFDDPNHDLYDQLGVRYLLTAPGRELAAPMERVYAGEDAWIYRRPTPRGRLFVASATPQAAPTSQISAIREKSPVALSARVDLAENGQVATSLFQGSGGGPQGGWHLVAGRPEGSSGAWATTLDNGPFLAFRLPEGSWTVELLYRPPGFLAGCLLAALGLALALAAGSRPPPGQLRRPRAKIRS